MTDLNRWMAESADATARKLRHGRWLAAVGLLSVTAATWLSLRDQTANSTLAGLSIAFFLLHTYYAIRTQIDARIFGLWAQHWHAGNSPEADMAALDERLGRSSSPLRPLSARIAGATRQLKRQTAAFAAQLSTLILAILWA